MASVVIGLDLGTTACKAVALKADGTVAASASQGYPLYSGAQGEAEQDGLELYQAATQALQHLAARLEGEEIAGLCLSGAMHSLLPAKRDGTLLARATTWADSRGYAQLPRLRRELDAQAYYQRTGCPLQMPYHPARLRWWREEAPDAFAQTELFVALSEWVLFKLTGVWRSSVGMASTTGLLDLQREDWDEEGLEHAGVSAEQLPTLIAGEAVVGELAREAAAQTGLPAGLPVMAGSSDGGLANLGSGVVAPGETVITVGTSGAVREVVAEPYLDAQARTWCYLLTQGCYFAGGAINNGGLALQWIRERFYPDLSEDEGYTALMREAAEAELESELSLLPYFAGERSPHWAPSASATLHGLTLHHERKHIARATLEAVVFCLQDVWDALGKPAQKPIRLTGAITRSPFWAQLLADAFGAPVAFVEAADASAVGAAMLGHWGLGLMESLSPLAGAVAVGKVLEPRDEAHQVYTRKYQAFRDLYRALAKHT